MRQAQARERSPLIGEVSRSGVIPEPTVTVRMEENERKTDRLGGPDFVSCVLILVRNGRMDP